MTQSMSITIDRMRLHARHGVMAQERRVGNLFEVSLELFLASPQAGADDSLESTVDYSAVMALVEREMSAPSQLLEHVAHRLRDAICKEFPSVTGGWVEVRKLTPPCGAEVASVGVRLRW